MIPVPRWIIIYTGPNAEGYVASSLSRERIEIYYPRIRRIIRHARKSTQVYRPYIPRYLFAAPNSSSEFDIIYSRRITGIQSILSNGGSPVYSPEVLIADLEKHRLIEQKRVDERNLLPQRNDVVEVPFHIAQLAGLLTSYTGRVIRTLHDGRLEVEVPNTTVLTTQLVDLTGIHVV